MRADPRDVRGEIVTDDDMAKAFVIAAGEIVSRYGVCEMAEEGEDTCSESPCTYCELVCLLIEINRDR